MAAVMSRRVPLSASKSVSLSSTETEMPPIDLQNLHPTPSSCEPRRPLAHMGFLGSRHLVPERLPSRRRERTVGLRVIDLNESTLENLRIISGSLRRLDLSNLNLEFIDPEMLQGLLLLDRLALDHNLLTAESFPEEFASLDNLIELSAHDNQLTELPSVLRKLKNLQRLKLSCNQLTNLDGIEKLKRLLLLVLDGNKLEHLTKEIFMNVKKLEYLYCARNSLTGIPGDIRHLRNLRYLDISQNNLSYLPPELFVLPRIEIINASFNQINRVPTLNIKGNLKRKLTTIDLSDNLLVRFPAHLTFMTNKLDLSKNKIKMIPLALIDKLDQVPDLKLILKDNPMNMPPQDVTDCGLRAIVQYFMEIKTVMRIHQGVKVLVIGATDQGKTSLVQSLVDQLPRLTEHELTLGVDIYDHSINLEQSGDPLNKHLDLSIWDFSGNERYLFQHQYFLQPDCLVFLVFNMADYTESKFKECFAKWIDWIISKTNKMIAIPIGTHADKLKPAKIKSINQIVMKQIQTYLHQTRASIDKEIKRIESKQYISPALSEQLKLYINLTKLETIVFEKVIPVSSKTFTGFEELEEAVRTVVVNKDNFQNVLREIPSLWGEVVNFIDDQGYAMQIPMLSWDDYVTLVTSKFGMRHLITAITEYMHDTGKVLWYRNHPTLKNFVFLRPPWLLDLFKTIFRHDILDMDYYMEESFKQQHVSVNKFEMFRRELVNEGIIDRDFIKCLWSGIFQTDMNRPVLEVLSTLLEHFKLGYSTTGTEKSSSAISSARNIIPDRLDHLETPTPTSKRKMSIKSSRSSERADTASVATNISKTADNPPKITKVLLPWLRDTKHPSNFQDEYKSFNANPHVVAVFRFPKYIPPGLFELFTTVAQNDTYDLQTLYHWKTGLYSRQAKNNVRLYLQKIDHDDGSTCVRNEVRQENGAVEINSENLVESLWQLMLPFLKECESLIASYKGARMERYMECPSCKSLSFLGEWLTPKDLQGIEFKTCDKCQKDIPTGFLVQPKEKKRVEEYLLQKLLEEAEKRRKRAAEAAASEIIVETITEHEPDKSDEPENTSPESGKSDKPRRKKSTEKGLEKRKTTIVDNPKSKDNSLPRRHTPTGSGESPRS